MHVEFEIDFYHTHDYPLPGAFYYPNDYPLPGCSNPKFLETVQPSDFEQTGSDSLV